MLIIDRDRLLLVHRFKDGREYCVLPGGGVEEGETPEVACVREAMEETGLVVELGEKLAVLINNGREDHYFHIARFTGIPQLGGPERERQSLTNQYHLEWVDSAQLDRIELVPIEARTLCREAFSSGETR